MADHININHPNMRDRWNRDYIAIAELKARINCLDNIILQLDADLDAIFTRIARGYVCELHMMNGDVYVIRGELTND